MLLVTWRQAIGKVKASVNCEVRRRRMRQSLTARRLSVLEPTVGRVPARADASECRNLENIEPGLRYDHHAPGDRLTPLKCTKVTQVDQMS